VTLTFESKYDLFRRFSIRTIGIQQGVLDEKDVSAKQYQEKENSRLSGKNEHKRRTKRSQAKENERKETTHCVGSKPPDDGEKKRII
jgi:hypothetical protein